MTFTEILKTAAIQGVSSKFSMDFINGTITKFDLEDIEEPILIKINQKLVLKKRNLIFTETYFSKIKKDDNVMLARTNDGQTYYVIDKLMMLP